MSCLKVFEVTTEGNYQFHLNQIKTVVEKIPANAKIMILSIIGTKRLGKSFVLNSLLQHFREISTGSEAHPAGPIFKSDGGNDRVTVGIDVWSEPLLLQDGSDVTAILLLDCQGDSDSRTYIPDNVIIFTFTQLLSSFMLYNVQGQIDESNLQQLVYMSKYAQEINSATYRGKFSRPNLLILLRDFQFEKEFGFGFSGPNEESSNNFESYYKCIFGGIENMPKENNMVRQDFHRLFQDSKTGIFTLPHPGRDFVRNAEQFSPEKDFLEQISKLANYISNNLEAKRFGASEMTKDNFCILLHKINEICQNNVIPPVEIEPIDISVEFQCDNQQFEEPATKGTGSLESDELSIPSFLSSFIPPTESINHAYNMGLETLADRECAVRK